MFGLSLPRVEGVDKVTGRARYAYEYEVDRAGLRVGGPGPNRQGQGRRRSVPMLSSVETGVLEVLWHANAPRLADVGDATLQVLQSRRSRLPRSDRSAWSSRRRLKLLARPRDNSRSSTTSRPTTQSSHRITRRLYSPGSVNAGYETDSLVGDATAAYAASDVQVDVTYTTPAEHNNPMEPHATTAVWEGDRLRLYDSNQGGQAVRVIVAKAFSIDPGAVDVISAHVGGGFGSKGLPRPNVMLAAMAARVVRTSGAVGLDPSAAVRTRRLSDADNPTAAIGCDLRRRTELDHS